MFRWLRDRRGVDNDGDMESIGLFTFALVEQDRIEWIEHFASQHAGGKPSAAQITQWFEDKPESYFLEKEKQAEQWYAGFARVYLSDEIEEGKAQAIRRALQNMDRFWPMFWKHNLFGLTSNLIFTGLVLLFALAIYTDFSFPAWIKGLLGSHPAKPS